MSCYLVVFAHGPTWDEGVPRRKQARWAEHARFADNMTLSRVIARGMPT